MKAILIAAMAVVLATSMASAGGNRKAGLGSNTSISGLGNPFGKPVR